MTTTGPIRPRIDAPRTATAHEVVATPSTPAALQLRWFDLFGGGTVRERHRDDVRV